MAADRGRAEARHQADEEGARDGDEARPGTELVPADHSRIPARMALLKPLPRQCAGLRGCGALAAGGAALATYVAVGAIVGLACVLVTRAVYGVEDLFERLPIHWMWWPALGAVGVGLIGWAAPDTLGVGYANIELVRRAPVCVSEEDSLRDASDRMVRERIGRLPVLSSGAAPRLVGILTRSDLLEAHADRLAQASHAQASLHVPLPRRAVRRSRAG